MSYEVIIQIRDPKRLVCYSLELKAETAEDAIAAIREEMQAIEDGERECACLDEWS